MTPRASCTTLSARGAAVPLTWGPSLLLARGAGFLLGRGVAVLLAFTPLLLGLSADQAWAAGDYTHLQILLPGETAAPGTSTGKMGTPRDQTAGVPFDVRVRACDAS